MRSCHGPSGTGHFALARRLRRSGGGATAGACSGTRRRLLLRPGQCDGPRPYQVDARMTLQNAHRPLRLEAAGAFLAHGCEMAHRAEALTHNLAFARRNLIGLKAVTIAR